jgi:alpha-tubulin suppressor-like RCC1 family protein
LWAWGLNDHGQLGDGTTVSKSSPVKIGTEANWTTITTRESHSLALKANGSLWAWGSNDFGQLGNGNTTDKNTPVIIQNDNASIAVSAGFNYSVRLQSNRKLFCNAGDNDKGQFGNGTFTSSNTFTCVPKAICADVNNDGVVKNNDLGEVLLSLGKTCTCPADLNKDGTVSSTDLGILLLSMGKSCGE